MIHTKARPMTFGAKVAPRQSGKRVWIKLILAAVLTVGSWQVGSSAYLLAKAHLAQYLIADAWQETLADGQPHPPWSWADTHPVARLNFPTLGKTSYVLEGASGRNMAFGPVHSETSGMPGGQISTVISAHNDSHFSFLGQLRLQDVIQIETLAGAYSYRIADIRVVDSDKQQISINQQDELILTTCYPFNALQTGGNLRYQVTANRL
jgi:sortase A